MCLQPFQIALNLRASQLLRTRSLKLQRNNVLLERASVKLPLEDIVILVTERLTSGEELSSDVGERTIFREMT
jgi:hypothetical protein